MIRATSQSLCLTSIHSLQVVLVSHCPASNSCIKRPRHKMRQYTAHLIVFSFVSCSVQYGQKGRDGASFLVSYQWCHEGKHWLIFLDILYQICPAHLIVHPSRAKWDFLWLGPLNDFELPSSRLKSREGGGRRGNISSSVLSWTAQSTNRLLHAFLCLEEL